MPAFVPEASVLMQHPVSVWPAAMVSTRHFLATWKSAMRVLMATSHTPPCQCQPSHVLPIQLLTRGNTGDTGGTDGGGTGDNGTGNTSGTNDSNTSSSTDNTTDVGVSDPVLAQKNESNVPALTFNMSLGNFPDTADVESIKVRLIAP